MQPWQQKTVNVIECSKKQLLGTVDKQVHCCQNKTKAALANRWITHKHIKMVFFIYITAAKKADFVTERDRKQRHPSVEITEGV